MGSDAHLVVVADDTALLVGAIARVGQLERRWSRFLARSEVSVLNRRAGRATRVSDDTRLLVARAIAAWRLTGGTFDPTVLGDVIRAGYDRSFDEIDAVARAGTSPLHRGASRITLTGDTVNLPVGVGFDPGGIGKGLAADLIASEALAGGAAGVCVNLGGDLRVCGRGPDGAAAWPIAVTYPGLADPIVTLVLGDGAVATSTTVRRRWTVRGRRRHHLIDPLTGEPSDSDLSLVTVVSGEAWTSEVLAKAELLRGSARLFDLVGGTGGEALAVTTTGDVLVTAGFRRFVVGPIPQRVALDLAVAS
jgi:thiamine biosynthesis lipoprotein